MANTKSGGLEWDTKSGGLEWDFFFKVVLIGDADVGKTSIFRRFRNGSFAQRRGSTAEEDKHTKILQVEGKRVALELWDTAGLERFRSFTHGFLKGAAAVILTYDIVNMESFRNIKNWHEVVEKLMGEHGICSILVGNKTDLEVSRKVSREEAEKCVNTYGMSALFETSAREFQNVTEMFEHIAWKLKRDHKKCNIAIINSDESIRLGEGCSTYSSQDCPSAKCRK
ncbi:hypothetical protein ACHWQZ_G004252 [Mnemiopsis leidyi]